MLGETPFTVQLKRSKNYTGTRGMKKKDKSKFLVSKKFGPPSTFSADLETQASNGI
jgi:hypothetical protein